MPNASFVESYVAFLDILGFSEIVSRVVSDDKSDDLERLYKCHQKSGGLIGHDPSVQITQFSDSIVISRPYDQAQFSRFIDIVYNYQRMLLGEGFLCRGGVSRGRHFANGSFMMSAGLVSAYLLEKDRARYPRVAVSEDLLTLVGINNFRRAKLLSEDDGVVFVDYLRGGSKGAKEKLRRAAGNYIDSCRTNLSSSVKEKGVWLAAYADRSLGSNFSMDRFFKPKFSAGV
jgi:hypothetical protein